MNRQLVLVLLILLVIWSLLHSSSLVPRDGAMEGSERPAAHALFMTLVEQAGNSGQAMLTTPLGRPAGAPAMLSPQKPEPITPDSATPGMPPLRPLPPLPPLARQSPRSLALSHGEGGRSPGSAATRTIGARTSGTQYCTVIGALNQQHCVEPDLQLRGAWKVHLIRQDTPVKGFRFHHLIHQGLAQHPHITLVASPFAADIILYLSTCTKFLPYMDPVKREHVHVDPVTATLPEAFQRAHPELAEYDGRKPPAPHPGIQRKLVVLDEGDGPGHVRSLKDGEYLAYFKRSWVRKTDGAFSGRPTRYIHNYFPMSYSISTNYTSGHLVAKRKYDVVCTLRLNKKQPARARVLDWIKESAEQLGVVDSSVIGEYLEFNQNAKIIVTCNPSFWEGDFRLWEALASGALVLVDEMFTPLPHPLVDGQHLVLFNVKDKEGFQRKLRYYIEHPQEAEAIGLRGYLYAMRYHRSVSRIDYIFRSIHSVLLNGQVLDVHGHAGVIADPSHRRSLGHSPYYFTAPQILRDESSLMKLHQRQR